MKIRLLTLLLAFCGLSISAQQITIPNVQHSLVTKRTATWCPNCAGYAWTMMENFIDNYNDKALSINAHHSNTSNLHSTTAEALIDNLEYSFYQPVFFHNTTNVGGSGSSVENTIIDKINAAAGTTPSAQTGLSVRYNPGTDMLEVSTETKFFQATSGDYRLSVFLIEKQVIADQATMGTNILHKNVLRKNISGSGFEGPLQNGSISQNAIIPAQYSATLGTLDVSNLLVATIIWKFENDAYKFINCNFTDYIDQATSLTELDAAVGKAILFPTTFREQATLQLDLNQELATSRIEVVDNNGRMLKTVYSGKLQEGQYTFEIQAADLQAKGTYFVRLTSNKGQKVLPFVVQ